MTTVLADAHLGLMVSDSCVIGDDRVWSGRKVHRIGGALLGFAGHIPELEAFIAWYRGGMVDVLRFKKSLSEVLVLKPEGLFLFDDNLTQLQKVRTGRESIGSGAKAAICAYEALGFTDPRRAVQIACKHDSNSRAPVRMYRLKADA